MIYVFFLIFSLIWCTSVCHRDSNNFYSSEKSHSNSLCCLSFDFLGEGKLKSLLCRKPLPLRDMEIRLANTIFTVSAVDNVLSLKRSFTMRSSMMQVRCLRMTTLMRPDSPRAGRVLCPGGLGASPPGGITGSWTWPSLPAGFWGSVKASSQAIPVSVLLLKKHYFCVLQRWTVSIFCPPPPHP